MTNISLPGRENDRGGEVVEAKLSVLDQVRAQLMAKRDVYFAGEIASSNVGGGWTEAVNIIIAPKKSIYGFRKLNKFMDGLIHGIKTSARDAAGDYMGGGISLGKLYFDERLGVSGSEVFTHVVAFEPDALLRAGIKIGESRRTYEERLDRRTWVRVYPDANVARIVADYESGIRNGGIEHDTTFNYLQHWITPEQVRLLKEKRNPFEKISGLLK